MKVTLCLLLSGFALTVFAQKNDKISPFNGAYWGVVLDHPDASKIVVKENIEYGSVGRPLHLDVYLPLSIGANESRTTVVILNGIGDQAGQRPLKSSAAQSSWARLLAANGFVVVTMESETNKVQESFNAFFRYLSENGKQHHVDSDNMGVMAFSANGRETISYIMSNDASKGIKSAVLFYGSQPVGPFRKDLPVLFIVAELDIRGTNYSKLWQEILKNNAPWTVALASEMPHAFDFFSDTDTSRRMIMSAVSFLKDRLGAMPPRTTAFSKEREIVAATYGPPSVKLKLMREWMAENPNSNDAYAFSAYGGALLDAQDYAEAEKYLGKAVDIDPKNKGTYLSLAVASYALGKKKEGDKHLAAYEKDSTPEGFTYWYIGNRLVGAKRYAEAIPFFERSVGFPDPRGFIYYNLGSCYAMTGNKDKAFENLSKAVAMEFSTKEGYEGDEKLQGLKTDKRWNELMGNVK